MTRGDIPAAVVGLDTALGAIFAGSMLPWLAARVRIDAVVVPVPFVTTLADTIGLVICVLISRAVLGSHGPDLVTFDGWPGPSALRRRDP